MHVTQRAVRDEALADDCPRGGLVTCVDRCDQRLRLRDENWHAKPVIELLASAL